MSQNFEVTMKKDDTGPPVRSCVTNDSDGKAPDWTGATATFFLLAIDLITGALSIKINGAAALIETPVESSGTLRYDWQVGDADTVGRFMAFFQVINAAGEQEVYPVEGYIWITVEERG